MSSEGSRGRGCQPSLLGVTFRGSCQLTVREAEQHNQGLIRQDQTSGWASHGSIKVHIIIGPKVCPVIFFVTVSGVAISVRAHRASQTCLQPSNSTNICYSSRTKHNTTTDAVKSRTSFSSSGVPCHLTQIHQVKPEQVAMKSLAVAGVFRSRAGKVLQLVTAATSGSHAPVRGPQSTLLHH
jgi:hypothetical protein